MVTPFHPCCRAVLRSLSTCKLQGNICIGNFLTYFTEPDLHLTLSAAPTHNLVHSFELSPPAATHTPYHTSVFQPVQKLHILNRAFVLQQCNLATKVKPAECSYARIPNKTIIKSACTSPGCPSTKTAPMKAIIFKKKMRAV